MNKEDRTINFNILSSSQTTQDDDSRYYRKNKMHVSLNTIPVGFPKRTISFSEGKKERY